MSTRGYNTYRGRDGGPRHGGLILLLVLVLLLSGGYLVSQNFLVYDAQGGVALELPFLRLELPFLNRGQPGENVDKDPAEQDPPPSPPEDEEDEVNLIIEPPPPPPEDPLRAREIQLSALAADTVPGEGRNGLVMEVKGSNGALYFRTDFAAKDATSGRAVSRESVTELLAGERDWSAVAALHTFHDSFYAFAHMQDAGICQPTGYIWYNFNTFWLEPAKEGTRSYLYGLARECEAMGFDEILLRGFTYPTAGNLHKIDYSSRTVTKEEALVSFLTGLRETLGEETKISLELEEALILAGAEEVSGLDISRLAPLVDRVYVAAEDPEAVWAALEPYVPEGRTRETYLVLLGQERETGSFLTTE